MIETKPVKGYRLTGEIKPPEFKRVQPPKKDNGMFKKLWNGVKKVFSSSAKNIIIDNLNLFSVYVKKFDANEDGTNDVVVYVLFDDEVIFTKEFLL